MAKSDDTDRLYKSIAKYLEKRGWKVLVIGGSKISQGLTAKECNYEFSVSFTGAKQDKA